jgi:phenylacetate-CoA ligase
MNDIAAIHPSWSDRFQFILLVPRDLLLALICLSYRTFIWGFGLLPPRYMAWTASMRARRAFFRAVRKVPAYRQYLTEQRASAAEIPETDKDSYIKAFPTEKRCVGGRLPLTETMIDESSGSTGTPYNWIRSIKERHFSHMFVSYFARYCYGTEPRITINAFSMGAWATGINMGLALQRNSIVKNTGPDIPKILHTLRFLGPQYRYLIMGYPPFLKHLIDVAAAEDFPLHEFCLDALVGGEGMSEGLRDYLLQRFQKVYSGYGATDLEIGIAGETPVTVAIRRLARDVPAVRQRLFGSDSRLPMIFQYNPTSHYIEVNTNRELVLTITRSNLLSPRIRYNVHDEGGIARYDEMADALRDAGFDIDKLAEPDSEKRMRLPFVWVYGRRDYTISVMGANIYPEDLEQCLYAERSLAQITRSFCLSVSEGEGGQIRPCFLFEVDCDPTEELKRRFSESMLMQLRELNADFREAWKEYPEAMVPDVQLFHVGQGPFADDARKIKQARLIRRV